MAVHNPSLPSRLRQQRKGSAQKPHDIEAPSREKSTSRQEVPKTAQETRRFH